MSERKSIPLAEASLAQLREFAGNVLGLEVKPNCNRETLIAKILQAGHNGDKITVPNEGGEESAVSSRPNGGDAKKPAAAQKEKVRILVETRDEPGGDQPVPVSVNGKAMLIPRGKAVDVPRAYVEVLSHSIRHVYDPLEGGGISTTPREVPAYPFRVIADPAPADKAAA